MAKFYVLVCPRHSGEEAVRFIDPRYKAQRGKVGMTEVKKCGSGRERGEESTRYATSCNKRTRRGEGYRARIKRTWAKLKWGEREKEKGKIRQEMEFLVLRKSGWKFSQGIMWYADEQGGRSKLLSVTIAKPLGGISL